MHPAPGNPKGSYLAPQLWNIAVGHAAADGVDELRAR